MNVWFLNHDGLELRSESGKHMQVCRKEWIISYICNLMISEISRGDNKEIGCVTMNRKRKVQKDRGTWDACVDELLRR